MVCEKNGVQKKWYGDDNQNNSPEIWPNKKRCRLTHPSYDHARKQYKFRKLPKEVPMLSDTNKSCKSSIEIPGQYNLQLTLGGICQLTLNKTSSTSSMSSSISSSNLPSFFLALLLRESNFFLKLGSSDPIDGSFMLAKDCAYIIATVLLILGNPIIFKVVLLLLGPLAEIFFCCLIFAVFSPSIRAPTHGDHFMAFVRTIKHSSESWCHYRILESVYFLGKVRGLSE